MIAVNDLERKLMVAERSPENIERLAGIHLQRYGNRLRLALAGKRGFRENELRHLLNLWESVAVKGFRWDALTDEEQLEVADAIMDEE